jgi:hypothetical protein
MHMLRNYMKQAVQISHLCLYLLSSIWYQSVGLHLDWNVRIFRPIWHLCMHVAVHDTRRKSDRSHKHIEMIHMIHMLQIAKSPLNLRWLGMFDMANWAR